MSTPAEPAQASLLPGAQKQLRERRESVLFSSAKPHEGAGPHCGARGLCQATIRDGPFVGALVGTGG